MALLDDEWLMRIFLGGLKNEQLDLWNSYSNEEAENVTNASSPCVTLLWTYFEVQDKIEF